MIERPTLCPTCKQPLPASDHVVMDPGDIRTLVIGGTYVRLTPNAKQVFLGLWRRQPRFVSKVALMNDLYGLEPEGSWPEEKIIDVFVCKLRSLLKGTPVEIETSWGEGFRIVVKEDVPA